MSTPEQITALRLRLESAIPDYQEMLSPAEADTSQPHPNLWAWRQARTSLAENDRIVVVFDADPSAASDDRFVLALRAAVDRAGA